jgi:hypothetical protein
LLLENLASERGRREEKRNEWDEKRREQVFIHLTEQLMAIPVPVSPIVSLFLFLSVCLCGFVFFSLLSHSIVWGSRPASGISIIQTEITSHKKKIIQTDRRIK